MHDPGVDEAADVSDVARWRGFQRNGQGDQPD